MNRRTFVVNGGAALLGAAVSPRAPARLRRAAPDVTLRIGEMTLELAPGKTVRTTAYNQTVPGPLIRLREGVGVTIDVVNDSDREEFVHWHGLLISSEADGSMDEGTPPIPAHGQQSYTFTPGPRERVGITRTRSLVAT